MASHRRLVCGAVEIVGIDDVEYRSSSVKFHLPPARQDRRRSPGVRIEFPLILLARPLRAHDHVSASLRAAVHSETVTLAMRESLYAPVTLFHAVRVSAAVSADVLGSAAPPRHPAKPRPRNSPPRRYTALDDPAAMTASDNNERTPLMGSGSRQNGAEQGNADPDGFHTYHVSPPPCLPAFALQQSRGAFSPERLIPFSRNGR